MRSEEVPTFGVLQGVNVLCCGTAIAGPFAATLMGEQGANVIHLENVGGGDQVGRSSSAWGLDHRNQRCLSLDIGKAEGQEVFLRLAKWANIIIESSKGGTFEKLGLDDEYLWKYNPSLVIVHLSGYGQNGLDTYVGRPGYDGIAQAFSGYMHWNGVALPDMPLRVKPYTADYVAPLFVAFSAISALRHAHSTGKGESIDVAQYETMLRIQGSYLQSALNDSKTKMRSGNREDGWAIYDAFRCKDEKFVMIMILGVPMWKKAISFFCLDKDPDFDDVHGVLWRPSTAANKADAAVSAYCKERNAAEVESELNSINIACSMIMTPQDMLNHPHYHARDTLIEWYDHKLERTIVGPNIIPKFIKSKPVIWRTGADYSSDTTDILKDLGYAENEIHDLAQRAVIPSTHL